MQQRDSGHYIEPAALYGCLVIASGRVISAPIRFSYDECLSGLLACVSGIGSRPPWCKWQHRQGELGMMTPTRNAS